MRGVLASGPLGLQGVLNRGALGWQGVLGRGVQGWPGKRRCRVPGVTGEATARKEQKVTQGFGGFNMWEGPVGHRRGGEIPRGRRENGGQREVFVIGLAEG